MKEKCLKNLGVLALNGECFGCGVAQTTLIDCQRNNVISREGREQVALKISKNCCPTGMPLILPRGSRSLW